MLIAAGRKDNEAANATRALLEGGADVNIKDNKGQTALYAAARIGKKEVVGVLLNHGINYYTLDNNGDIARTIAFRAGHADIVQMMDDFVKAQTLQAKGIEQNQHNAEGLQQRLEREKQEKAKRQEEERQKKALKEYQNNLKLLPEKIHDMAYAACAFQYWSFVQATKQTIPLSAEQLEETISIHKNEVKESAFEIMKMFNTGHSYVNQVINPSKKAIFNELDQMPSRTYRKELGVGTPKDADARCLKVAKTWNIIPGKKP